MRLDVLLLGDDWDVVVLGLAVSQQLEPAPGALALAELRHAETRNINIVRGLMRTVSPDLSAPMKSFLEVLSQSQTSIKTLRSLSSCFKSLRIELSCNFFLVKMNSRD